MDGVPPHLSPPLEVIRIGTKSLFSQEDLVLGSCPLVPPTLALFVALLLPFVPSSAHSSAIATSLSFSLLISGINCVRVFSSFSQSSC